MKLRFYPKAEVVRNLVTESYNSAGNKRDKLLTELEKLEERSGVLYRADHDIVGARLRSDITSIEDRLETLQNYKILLESHSPPEIMVEVDDEFWKAE